MLASIWGIAEPLIFLLQLLLGLRFSYHSKVSERQFEILVDEAFREVKNHLEYFNAQKAIEASEEAYKEYLKSKIKYKKDQYIFLEGEIQLKLLQQFNLSTNCRINKFLILSFFLVQGLNHPFYSLLLQERIKKFFGKKNTFLHYLSISNWSNKSIQVLQKEVIHIKKVQPNWNDRYRISKGIDIAKERPNVGKAIDRVLAKGIITVRSIFNLASSEKLIFVHKYGEGFSNVFTAQRKEAIEAKEKIEKLKNSKAKSASKRLQKAKFELQKINKDWMLVPIGYALENLGFQKLFNKMDGVYVLPLSMIPEKYQKEVEAYIEEIVIEKAQLYIDTAVSNKNNFVTEENQKLKFIILTHVVTVSEIKILTQERSIEISSPTLSRMLFTGYLSKDNSKAASLYINDIIRNVDFKSLLRNSKTDKLLIHNFESIKAILWQQFNIDIFKPALLLTLTANQQNDLIEKILLTDNEFKKALLSKKIKEIVQFYSKLNDELNQIKVN